jgi:hypothetical protein
VRALTDCAVWGPRLGADMGGCGVSETHTADVVTRLEARLAAIEDENCRLAAEVQALKTSRNGSGNARGDRTGPISRRDVFRVLGGAAAGAGLVASGAVGAQPASAGTDGDVVLGGTAAQNDAGSAVTHLTSNAGGAPAFTATNTALYTDPNGAGTGVQGISGAASGIPGVAAAVVGETNATLVNAVAALTTGAEAALLAIHNGGAGEGVSAVIQDTTNDSVCILGVTNGTNAAIRGEINNGGTAAAVEGLGSNAGPGVRGFGGVGAEGMGGLSGIGAYGHCDPDIVDFPTTPVTGIGVKAQVRAAGQSVPSAASIAVLAVNQGLGAGVNAQSAHGVGVAAQGGLAPLFLVPASGAAGPPASGTHSKGEVFVDSAGAHWLCTGAGTPGTRVRVLTTGTNSLGTANTTIQASGAGVPLQLSSTGTGTPFYCNINNTGSAAPAIKGYTNGTGSAVVGQIANASNSAPALNGTTSGTGPAVQGVCSNASGRGGFFQGGDAGAAIRLRPATGSHPSSGLAGDLFVDSSNQLWFCKGGTLWKQVQLV